MKPIIIKSPILPYFIAFALFGKIILIKKGHEDAIPHELIHIEQQQRIGIFKYHWKWIFDKKFRAKVEIEAFEKGDGYNRQIIIDILRDYYNIDLTTDEYDTIVSNI